MNSQRNPYIQLRSSEEDCVIHRRNEIVPIRTWSVSLTSSTNETQTEKYLTVLLG